MGFRIRPAMLPSDRGAMLDVLETVNMHRVREVPKLHEFGLPEVDRWTTLEASLR
jgi:hypothetical protein